MNESVRNEWERERKCRNKNSGISKQLFIKIVVCKKKKLKFLITIFSLLFLNASLRVRVWEIDIERMRGK